MVTNRKPRTPVRKPKPDPVARARAEAAKGVGAVDPVLAAMVAEFGALAERFGNAAPCEVEAAAGRRHTELHMAIAAFPVSSLADLCAKLPIFRDDLSAATDRADGGARFEEASLRGLVADLERLAGTGAPRAAAPQDAAGVDFEPIAGIAPLRYAEWDTLSDAHFDRIEMAFALLGKTKPELMRTWAAEEAGVGAAGAMERARDWLAGTAAVVDEALARFLAAGAARAAKQAAEDVAA